jgi:hypothetical protein
MTAVPILVYTHSEYSFLWDAMVPLLKLYASEVPIYWLTNDSTPDELRQKYIPNTWNYLTYNEHDIWTTRVATGLNSIKEDYVLFLHEDWLPVGKIEPKILSDMTKFMKNQNCGYLLSYSHYSKTDIQEGIESGYQDYLFFYETDHIFQPAIWKKSVFLQYCTVLKKSKHENEDMESRLFMKEHNCWSVQNKKTVRTLRTTNSLFFPHMHALSEGLWNFTKYPTLETFLQSFGIDTKTRGVHSWWELDTQ